MIRGRLAARTVGSLQLFRGLAPAALQEVSALARVRRLPKDDVIFNQGDLGVRAHVVIEGSVRIAQSGSDGAQVVVRFIAPGEMFGAMALFTDGHYPADAVTLVETVEASWAEAELQSVIAKNPQIAMNVVRIVGRRLQEAQARVRELSTQSVEQRVANAIVRLSRQAGRRSSDGIEIKFPLRRKDVGDISGTTLHSVSRILTAWEKAGLVRSRDRRLTVCAPAEILRIAGEE